MPVIVVGADTEVGGAIVDALAGGDRELRVFITDPAVAQSLKERRVKVAIGDVSDGSHVGGAALNVFTAVLVAEAAHDDRERSFAADPAAVVAAWAEGIGDAGVRRIIWVGDPEEAGPLAEAVTEFAAVVASGLPPADVADEVARLDEAAAL